jgi:lipopolysaccharide transport system ATP-binding protein
VGIIGRNGSGKSTLLQIIAGTLQPTSGQVNVNGKVAALLELGSGFNPEFTGRENVFLNGAVLGLSKAKIEAKFDAIASFADIGDFIDQPIKTYSSGMIMRLAFAVQTAVEPDILIVDEALSVGDAPFQAKCFARIRALQELGCSILFVSHDVTAVLALCKGATLLSHGLAISQGSAKQVCDDYQLLCLQEQGIATAPRADGRNSHHELLARAHAYSVKRNPEFEKNAQLQRSGNGAASVIDCYLEDSAGRRVRLVDFNQEVIVCWLIQAQAKIDAAFVLSFTIKTIKGQSVLSATDKLSELRVALVPGDVILARMPYRFPLKADHYYFTTSLFAFPHEKKFENGTINFDRATLVDLIEYSCYFEVNWDRRWCHYGPVQQDSTVELITLPPLT